MFYLCLASKVKGSVGSSAILFTSRMKSSDLTSKSVSAPDDSDVEKGSLSMVLEGAASCASVGKFLRESSRFLLKPGGKNLFGTGVEMTGLLLEGGDNTGRWKGGTGGIISGDRGGNGWGKILGRATVGGGGVGARWAIRWKLVWANIKTTHPNSVSIRGVL